MTKYITRCNISTVREKKKTTQESSKEKKMTLTEARKIFNGGFTRFYNSIVKSQYKMKKSELWKVYSSELINTENIEISSHLSKDNRPHIW